jgi:hypothetical protein
MINGQHFLAISKYSGKVARRFTKSKKGLYTFQREDNEAITCKERTNRGMPVMIFHSVFKIVEGT